MSRLAIQLARRFGRSVPARRSATLAVFVGTAVMALFMAISAFDQTGAQLAEQQLGRFDGRVELVAQEAIRPGHSFAFDSIHGAVEAAGADYSSVVLESYDVRPATPEAPFAIYLEGQWSSEMFSSRYQLLQGAWPTKAGEVVVTNQYINESDLSGALDLPATTSVLSGNTIFRVVGVIQDIYATTSSKILAAPGTWEALPGELLAERYPTLGASASIVWTGGNDSEVVSAILAASQTPQELAAEWDTADRAGDFGVWTRTALIGHRVATFSSSIPLAYSGPSVVLPIAAALIAFGLYSRRSTRNIEILRSVGIDSATAQRAITLAVSFWLIMGTLIGLIAGLAVGAVARAAIQPFATRPLAPIQGITDTGLKHLLVIVAICGWKLITASRTFGSNAVPSALATIRTATLATASTLHKAVIVVLASVSFFLVMQLETVPGSMTLIAVLAALAALLVAQALPHVLAATKGSTPQNRLAIRQLLTDRSRGQAVSALLTASFAITLGMTIMMSTLTSSEAGLYIGDVPSGQIRVTSPDGGPTPPLASLVDAVSNHLVADRTELQSLATDDGYVALLDNPNLGLVTAVNDATDVDLLTGTALSQAEIDTLESGGILLWAPSLTSNQGQLQLIVVGNESETVLEAIPASYISAPIEWSNIGPGVMLNSTASALELPTRPFDVVFTGITDDDAAQALAEVSKAGFDPAQVRIWTPPTPPIAPLAYWGATVGLAILLLGVGVVAARSQAQTLRTYLSGLVALGMTPAWAKGVLYRELAVLFIASYAIGTATALLGVGIAAIQVPNLDLNVPIATLVALSALFAVSGIAAAFIASRNLNPASRIG